MEFPTKKGRIDWYIFLPVVGLMLFSIAFVYSASASIASIKFGSAEGLFVKHTFRVLLGIAVMLAFSVIDYHKYKKIAKPIMYVAIGLLIVVLFTNPLNNVSRWIQLGPVSFQPSEFAKFGMVIYFAALLEKKQHIIKDFKEGYVPFLIWTGIICFLIALQPNFSTATVIFLIAIVMLFVGNTNLLHVLGTFGATMLLAFVYLTSTQSYRLNRILAYFGDQEMLSSEKSINYQLDQALIAIGNGGLFGVGPGQSRQSHLYLPESYGDFIFSIIGEEYGLFGLTVILAAFGFIFWRGLKIAKNAPDLFGYMLATGIIITFALYVFVNAGVNCGLLPTTGLPMPFISYGGTAIFFYAAAIGILLNISTQAGVYPSNKQYNDLNPDY